MAMRGIIFTLDALYALIIISALVPLVMLVVVESSSSTVSQERMHVYAEDSIDMIVKLKVSDVIREPAVMSAYQNGVILDVEMDNYLIDVLGMLWSSGGDDLVVARNITKEVLGKYMPENVRWALLADNDTIYNTTYFDAKRIATITRRMASGYARELPYEGYVARAYLGSIKGKLTASYAFFGGFEGEGNVSKVIYDIPSDATILDIYIELGAPVDFTLYINDNNCGYFSIGQPIAGYPSVSNWTITNPTCLGYLRKGDNNTFLFIFNTTDLTNKYIAGGYARVRYTTSQMYKALDNTTRYNFPGIYGLINLYSSFYVPGKINSMSAKIHFYGNFTTNMTIGNVTVINTNAQGEQTILINNATFGALLKYTELYKNTTPLRMATVEIPEIIIGGKSDSVLITDVSGSMSECNVFSASGPCDCQAPPPCNRRKINVAKEVDNEFVDVILNVEGNRVGLVNYSTKLVSYHNLSSDNSSLKKAISGYINSQNTCISCGILKANQLLSGNYLPRESVWKIINSTPALDSNGRDWFNESYDDSDWTSSLAPYAPYKNYTIGIAGDYQYQIYDFLRANGFVVVKYNDYLETDWNKLKNEVKYLKVLILNLPGNPGSATFNDVINQADANNVSIIFLDNYGSNYYGIGLRDNYMNDPDRRDQMNASDRNVYYNVTQNHPIFNGYAVGENIYLYHRRYYSWWRDGTFSGTTIGDVRAPVEVRRGGGVGIADRPKGNKHVLLSTLGVSNYVDLNTRWTADAKKVFLNTVNWLVNQSEIDKNNTFYLRKTFQISDIENITKSNAFIYSDDRAEIYLNGYLIYNDSRDNTGSYWNNKTDINISYFKNNTNVISAKLRNDDNSTGFDFELYGWNGKRYRAMLIMSDGQANTRLDGSTSGAVQEAVNFACNAHENFSIAIYSVAFGSDADTTSMRNMACCDECSHFYNSSDSDELKEIYRKIANEIVNATYEKQTVNLSGNLTTALYPDSFIEFNITREEVPLEFREISLIRETSNFSNCNGSFFVPSQLKIDDMKISSYSAEWWTDNLTYLSQSTVNWINIFNLRKYNRTYRDLGDPYIIQVPADYVYSGGVNNVTLRLGTGPGAYNFNCSSKNRGIYEARIRASVPYEKIFPELIGRNVTIYYDKDYDGNADGYVTIAVGEDLPNFDPTPIDVDNLDIFNNALDDAIYRLLDYLNFVETPGNSGRPGSQTNPIDIELSQDVSIRTSTLTGVPYMWGPAAIGVSVWI